MKRRIGAHVSVGNGLVEALEKVNSLGANCIQIFAGPPLSYAQSKFTDNDAVFYKKKALELDITPVFIHARYLINLASTKESLRQISIKTLIGDLIVAEKIGAKGVIVHTGSHKGLGFKKVLPLVKDSLEKILSQTPASIKLYLEVASGGNGKLGSTAEELHELCVLVSSKRIGVCLDTAHLFAGGVAFDTDANVAVLSKNIESTIGWDEIACMHVNDSKAEFGSFRDKHENLGEGFIGKSALKLLLNTKHFNKIPLILETPGFDGKGPDKKNVDILKSLVDPI